MLRLVSPWLRYKVLPRGIPTSSVRPALTEGLGRLQRRSVVRPVDYGSSAILADILLFVRELRLVLHPECRGRPRVLMLNLLL